jgi:hypothetical protein
VQWIFISAAAISPLTLLFVFTGGELDTLVLTIKPHAPDTTPDPNHFLFTAQQRTYCL